jgi:hypothetical protein
MAGLLYQDERERQQRFPIELEPDELAAHLVAPALRSPGRSVIASRTPTACAVAPTRVEAPGPSRRPT